jgi:hypothetical protein
MQTEHLDYPQRLTIEEKAEFIVGYIKDLDNRNPAPPNRYELIRNMVEVMLIGTKREIEGIDVVYSS